MVPGSVTGRMKASSRAVLAEALTELTDPANSTTRATTDIATADSHTGCDASVPSETSTAPTTASAASACARSRSGPPKSTKSSIANDPNAEKIATSGLRRTPLANANSNGITMAARLARRSAL